MKLKLKFLRPFKDITGKSELGLDIEVSNLKDLLKILVDKYPKLEKEIFKKNNELTDYICIFVNDKPISALNWLDTKLENGDNLLFFVPVSGG
ncbi:MAG: MoaD family protein [Thermoplasmatales archaeon]|nr:MAG: MoaD family protein [Thermoplasmatales archaeon]